MSSTLRFQIVGEAFKKKPIEVPNREERPSEFFAKYVFTRQKMQKYLPAEVYKKMCDVIDGSAVLDMATADAVAAGMKKWAMELGVTHCTHWFQPLTEGTAEKHDGFVEHDGKGGMVEEFTGKQLVQQEPDASSFPSGGIRSTFEARGYSAWDPASRVFVIGDTLMIPTIFISYTGEALDYKAPLKKALKAVDKAATAVAQYFYPDVTKVISNLGWEQEYFLVDEGLYAARPDLLMTGRTLLGHDSAKNQQMDDHYLGSIPMRVAAFMKDLEIQALELGIPCKTRHNEVAPNQFELAPIYEETNLAVDHNMLIMSLMKRTARKHGFRCLLHEKPFAGINGSGKHCNWSLATNTGVLLHGPGKTPLDNLRFVTFIVESLMAVYRHNGLLKASIISATNVHRLGASEAPPAIVSSFLGKTLGELLEQLETTASPILSEEGLNLDAESHSPFEKVGERLSLSLDIPQIPELMQDDTDRNRTSPFAFTGNRFEFRAVGSCANCAGAMTTLNAAVAEQLIAFKAAVDKELATGKEKGVAIMDALKPIIRSVIGVVCFDGNGYTEEWKQEAIRRGLDVETNVPKMFCEFTKPASVEMFTKTGVYTEKELEARNEVKWETYVKKVQIESRVMVRMALNHIVPAALEYKAKLLKEVTLAKGIYGNLDGCTTEMLILDDINKYVEAVRVKATAMREARKAANMIEDIYERALAYHDIAESLYDLRKPIDKLEELVDNRMWPLPKYRELLFIS